MRKYQQEQILELIKTLNEANTEIKRLYASKEYSSAIELLTDCQNSAVYIGNFIDLIKGEGSSTVACLEVYCEILYQTCEAINNSYDIQVFLKKLQRQLI